MASRKRYFLVASALLLGSVAAIFLVFKDSITGATNAIVTSVSQNESSNSHPLINMDKTTLDAIQRRINERNHASRMLNDMKKEIGQLECNMAKLKKERVVSSSGGYCEEDSDPKVTHAHRFDVKMANVVGEFFTGQTVGGFGDGPGQYRDHLLKQGRVISYEAYDGAPFVEKVTGGAVKFMDLTLPQYGLPAYDWVMCLEVAEHIPARYERILVDNMARHARKGVVLSWGKIGQGGFNHVNNKSPEDVKKLMDEAGFYPDDNATQHMRNNSEFECFKVNTIVFRRKPEAIFHEEDAETKRV